MSGSAPKEIQGIPTRENTIVHLPTQEEKWRGGIVQHVQNIPEIQSSFTEKEATPPATQPFPESPEMKEIGVERTGAEPVIDLKDVTDIIGNVIGGTIKEFGVKDSQTYIGTTGGKPPVRKFKEMLQKKFGKKAA